MIEQRLAELSDGLGAIVIEGEKIVQVGKAHAFMLGWSIADLEKYCVEKHLRLIWLPVKFIGL